MEIKPQNPEKKKNVLNITFGIFAVSIALFTAIGGIIMNEFSSMQQLEELAPSEEHNDNTAKRNVDDRLRFIEIQDSDKIITIDQIEQKQDNEEDADEIAVFFDKENSKNVFQEYNEKYKKDKKPEAPLMNAPKENEQAKHENSDEPFIKDQQLPPTPMNMKVVVGNYATKEEAQAGLVSLQNKFTEAPFIKVVNGHYVIQVASFKTPNTAHDFANSLRAQGHYVRIIEE